MEAIIRQLKIADITGDYNAMLRDIKSKMDQLYMVSDDTTLSYINAYGDLYFYFDEDGTVFCDRSFYSLFTFYNQEYNYNRHERGKFNKHMIIIVKLILDQYFNKDLRVNVLPMPLNYFKQ